MDKQKPLPKDGTNVPVPANEQKFAEEIFECVGTISSSDIEKMNYEEMADKFFNLGYRTRREIFEWTRYDHHIDEIILTEKVWRIITSKYKFSESYLQREQVSWSFYLIEKMLNEFFLDFQINLKH